MLADRLMDRRTGVMTVSKTSSPTRQRFPVEYGTTYSVITCHLGLALMYICLMIIIITRGRTGRRTDGRTDARTDTPTDKAGRTANTPTASHQPVHAASRVGKRAVEEEEEDVHSLFAMALECDEYYTMVLKRHTYPTMVCCFDEARQPTMDPWQYRNYFPSKSYRWNMADVRA